MKERIEELEKELEKVLGVVAMTPDQARRAEKDFIVKEA